MADTDFQSRQPYVVRLEGEALTLRDRMVVSQALLVLLEESLGGPARVIACFRAWSRQLEPDFQWMNETEQTDARAWQRAFERASDAAQRMLSRPGSGTFSFELA
ncbi:hypothetical protein [Variovorax sp. EL159]|uniref:hypothetical protein n=1 Tax=Variovorax sp. EL159 TaxID=1566270 RepID=UPI00088AB849|nr:hypothetical protein [Variovorax sp. EL159]SCX58763.1 hypothetical protein SAMN03159363_1975 [Variovorax sp. EL159]